MEGAEIIANLSQLLNSQQSIMCIYAHLQHGSFSMISKYNIYISVAHTDYRIVMFHVMDSSSIWPVYEE